MAASAQRLAEAARQASILATDGKQFFGRMNLFLSHMAAMSYDLTADPCPDYIVEDANGNIQGLDFSRQDLANAIGSFTQIRNLALNQTVTEGDHLVNLEKLARP